MAKSETKSETASETNSTQQSISSTVKPFFHTTVNVTEWMKNEITKLLENKKFKIVTFDIDTEIMARMSRMSVFNNVTLKFQDGDGKIHLLENYSSANKKYDESSDVRWLVDGIKELEMAALLKYGSTTLSTKKVSEGSTPKLPKNTKIEKVKNCNLEIELYTNGKASDFVGFLTDRKCVERWTCGKAKIEDGCILLEGVKMSGIESVRKNGIEGAKMSGIESVRKNAKTTGVESVKMDPKTNGMNSEVKEGEQKLKMKFNKKGWDESEVVMTFTQVENSVKIVLRQSKVPIEEKDETQVFWHRCVFGMISVAFNAVIKSFSSKII